MSAPKTLPRKIVLEITDSGGDVWRLPCTITREWRPDAYTATVSTIVQITLDDLAEFDSRYGPSFA